MFKEGSCHPVTIVSIGTGVGLAARVCLVIAFPFLMLSTPLFKNESRGLWTLIRRGLGREQGVTLAEPRR